MFFFWGGTLTRRLKVAVMVANCFHSELEAHADPDTAAGTEQALPQ